MQTRQTTNLNKELPCIDYPAGPQLASNNNNNNNNNNDNDDNDSNSNDTNSNSNDTDSDSDSSDSSRDDYIDVSIIDCPAGPQLASKKKGGMGAAAGGGGGAPRGSGKGQLSHCPASGSEKGN